MAKNATNRHTNNMDTTFATGLDPGGWLNVEALHNGSSTTDYGHPIRFVASSATATMSTAQNSSALQDKRQVIGANLEPATSGNTFRLNMGGYLYQVYISGAASQGTFLYIGDGTAAPSYAVTAGSIGSTMTPHGRHTAFAIAAVSNASGSTYIEAIVLPWRV